jgi:hypothetical protein
MWDAISPDEYFQWVKGVIWSDTQHIKQDESQRAPQVGVKGKRSGNDKQESSCTIGKGKAPQRKGQRNHPKDLATEKFFDELEERNTKKTNLKAQAKDRVVHEIEVKEGGTLCPPDRDDDILMVLKIK